VQHDEPAFCWEGEISDFAGAFAQLQPSANYAAVYGGIERSFSMVTREDYETAFRSAGDLPDTDEIQDRPDLVAAAQAHWHATGSNGCRFAAYMSEHRHRFGWETWVVVAADDDVTAVADSIVRLVDDRLPHVEVDVLSIVLPHVRGPEPLGQLVRRLGQQDDWRLRAYRDRSVAELELLGLSVGLDLNYWSEILGFGSAAPLANTRRAPFSELAIRAKPPKRRESSDQRAHMAQVRLDVDGPTLTRWRRATERSRAERLGVAHDSRGKARVTTVVHTTEVTADDVGRS
jgi:hypothetical protein